MSNYNPPDPLPPPLTIFNNVNWEIPDVISGGGGGAGPQGIAGPQGLQGVQGSAGSAGSAGSQGLQGIVGFQGIVGPTGAGSGGSVGSTLYSAEFQEFRTGGAPVNVLAYTTTIVGGTADRFRTYLTGRFQGATGTISIGVTGSNPILVPFNFPPGYFQFVIENFPFKNQIFSGSQYRTLITATWNDLAQTSTFQRFHFSSAGGGDPVTPFSLYVLVTGVVNLEHFSTEKLSKF
jgi:hypothetical protein